MLLAVNGVTALSPVNLVWTAFKTAAAAVSPEERPLPTCLVEYGPHSPLVLTASRHLHLPLSLLHPSICRTSWGSCYLPILYPTHLQSS